MIIDIHGHLGNINFARFWQADAPTLERYCDESNTDLLCLSSSRSIMYDVREGNAELDKALKETEKLLGYVVVSPTFPESLADLSYLKTNPKFKGATQRIESGIFHILVPIPTHGGLLIAERQCQAVQLLRNSITRCFHVQLFLLIEIVEKDLLWYIQ